MPIKEALCESCDIIIEHYYHNQSLPAQACEQCGGPTQFVPSTFNAPWTGDLSRFIDPKASMVNQHKEGHIAYRVKSSRLADGNPEKVVIKTRQDQLSFIRDEQLSDPFESNIHDAPTADGTQSSSRPRGAWV